ncbi:MAG TPA: TolC family protein [Chitinophagaceae bacterium]|nr:TolC family protein [Chitinophagaceae bacterium]
MYSGVAGVERQQSSPFFLQQHGILLYCCVVLACLYSTCLSAQNSSPFYLSAAVKNGVQNYQSIRARGHYLAASGALVENARNLYLPDITASLQEAYGTINGQFGPAAGFGGAGIASAGPAYTSQSWNAAFGAVYLLNANWEVISFGRLRSRVAAARAQLQLDSANLLQEQFVHSVRVAGTYLNLLIAQRFIQNAQANIERAAAVQQSVIARAKTGLIAGVDSSIANAEVSGARLSLLQAVSNEQRIRNQLAQLLNASPDPVILDSSFFSQVPSSFSTSASITQNPQVQYYERRIAQSYATEKLLRNSINPGLNLFGTFQGRGSGFDYNYTPDFTDRYSKSYFTGIKPERYNYLLGIGIAWNLMSPLKIKQQVRSQSFLSAAYKDEYDQVATQLKDQLVLADQQIENSLQSIREAPVQLKAATDAYLQKTVLYKNGLANIVDVQQALFTLNRAQTDNSVAYINIWQALLLKAAASGDFDLFIKQVK